MKPQSQFETVSHQRGKSQPEKVSATRVRRHAQQQARRQMELASRRREAGQLRTMIGELQREVANLDDSMASELAMSGAREPSRIVHSVSIAMMRARRDNLKVTLAALTDRLSAVAQTVAEPDGSLADAALGPQLSARFDFSQE